MVETTCRLGYWGQQDLACVLASAPPTPWSYLFSSYPAKTPGHQCFPPPTSPKGRECCKSGIELAYPYGKEVHKNIFIQSLLCIFCDLHGVVGSHLVLHIFLSL